MNKASDLRGAARLAADATAGLTDLVEAMHERIARVPGLGGVLDGRTRGITGLVYGSVRGVTRLVGGSVDALLGLLAPALPAADTSPEREAVVAALNGVLGDHLQATGNPLAIPMALKAGGAGAPPMATLPLDREALAAALPEARGTLVVALHGLCMNPLQWQREGHDQAAALAQALGGTAVYLHYNSGLPVARNGREFGALLAALLAAWPLPLKRVVLLGHSMGGLVVRSALHQAAGAEWMRRIDDIVFLGTPHQGAPLERAGHGVDVLLEATPYSAPLARLGRVRSAGITDLRHGHCGNGDEPVPLPDGPRAWAVAATLDESLNKTLKGRLLGDGLVTVDSALGRHAEPERTLAFAPARLRVVTAHNHLQLLSSPVVAAQLQRWLSAS